MDDGGNFKLYRREGDDLLVKAKKIKNEKLFPLDCNSTYVIFNAKTEEFINKLPEAYFELMYKEDLGFLTFEHPKYGEITLKEFIKKVFLEFCYDDEKEIISNVLIEKGYIKKRTEAKELILNYLKEL